MAVCTGYMGSRAVCHPAAIPASPVDFHARVQPELSALHDPASTENGHKMPEIAAVHTDHAPEALGPYSQAVVTGDWIFASGQIPIDPRTGLLVEGAVQDQTDRVLRNLEAVLAAAGGGLRTVVKTTVYLSDMAFFTDMNTVYARHFGEHRPARATVAVAGLPKGVDVEIEVVARVG